MIWLSRRFEIVSQRFVLVNNKIIIMLKQVQSILEFLFFFVITISPDWSTINIYNVDLPAWLRSLSRIHRARSQSSSALMARDLSWRGTWIHPNPFVAQSAFSLFNQQRGRVPAQSWHCSYHHPLPYILLSLVWYEFMVRA